MDYYIKKLQEASKWIAEKAMAASVYGQEIIEIDLEEKEEPVSPIDKYMQPHTPSPVLYYEKESELNMGMRDVRSGELEWYQCPKIAKRVTRFRDSAERKNYRLSNPKNKVR